MKQKRIPFSVSKWAVLTLILGLTVSLLLAWWLQVANHQRLTAAVEQEADKLSRAVTARLERYEHGLRGARGVVLSAGEEQLSRQLFQQYSLTREIDREFPGARGIGLIRRVPANQEADFVARARADDWPGFAVRQLGENSGERFIIQYIEPVQRNLQAVGLDIASEEHRRSAAVAAMHSGVATLTQPITLVQATGETQQAFLLLLPVYRGWVVPLSDTEREAATLGWTYAPLVMGEVLNGLVAADHLSFTLADVGDEAKPLPFFNSAPAAQDADPATSIRKTWPVFGRQWSLTLRADPRFVKQYAPYSPALALTVGSLLSLLLAALVNIAGLYVQRLRQIVSTQGWLSAIVESSAEAIIGQSLSGEVLSWNKGAERLFGIPEEQALGRPVRELIRPEGSASEFLEQLSRCEALESYDLRLSHREGALLDVAITVAPIRDTQQQVIGASISIRDISMLKALGRRMQTLNAELEAQAHQRTAELEASLETTRGILDTAKTPIITIDGHGVIRSCNPASEKSFGYSADQMIGRNVSMLMPERFARDHDHFMAMFRQSGGGRALEINREIHAQRADGSVFPVQISLGAMTVAGEQLVVGILTDLSEQHRQREEVTRARNQLTLASEVAGLGTWRWNLVDNTLDWNERMYELYEVPLSVREQGLSYEHWRSRIHPEDIAEAERQLQAAITGESTYAPCFRLILADGSLRYIQAAARVERDASGQALCVTGMNLDVTGDRELQASLQAAKEQADAASAAKSSFLANMSHEIRTPMNAVLGMLQLMRQTELTARQTDYLGKAHSAATSLLGLLNDILDYSKIEAGKLQLDQHDFELESLMQDLGVILTGNQGQKNVEVLFDLDTGIPSTLVGDRLRLQQVLINLAGNALKFTEQGQVLIRVRLLQLSDSTARLHIGVSDSGIGIDPEQLTRIFDSFTQAESSTTRRFGGTGLGLFISRCLIELMGGQLQVESTPGQGSCFFFELDLPVAASASGQTLLGQQPSIRKVLVVDDNALCGEVMLHTLAGIGWTADWVDSGLKAVGKVMAAAESGHPYEVILMDWRMPEFDGMQSARMIRMLQPDQLLPAIVMITAHGQEPLEALIDDESCPFNAVLSKPMTPAQVIRGIEQALGLAPAQEQPHSSRPHTGRLAGLRLLVVEDNALNRQIAEELLASEGATVALAVDGQQGVEAVLHAEPRYDLVLMDMRMPVMDGLQATRQIRAAAGFETLPIIAMTANASPADQQDCREAGMNAHVAKPIDLEVLVAAIQRQLGTTPETAPSIENAPSDAEPLVDRDAVLARFSGNLELVQRLVTSFAGELETLLPQLQELQRQAAMDELQRALHTLKGMAGNMGALLLAAEAARYEAALKQATDAEASAVLQGLDLRALEATAETSMKALRTTFGMLSPAH